MIDDYVNPNPQPKSQVNSQVNLQAESSLGLDNDEEMSSNSGKLGGGKKKARKPSAKAAPKPAAKAAPKKKK